MVNIVWRPADISLAGGAGGGQHAPVDADPQLLHHLPPADGQQWLDQGADHPLELPAPLRGLGLPLHPGHVGRQPGGQVPSQWNSAADAQPAQASVSLNQDRHNLYNIKT